MYLYFENWTQFLYQLDVKGISHGDKLLKVKASKEHPSARYGRNNIAVYEIDEKPFRLDELFDYGERGSWQGTDLEITLQSLRLNTEQQTTARALFRFANLPHFQMCQAGMELRNPNGSWLINHPLEDIDGLRQLMQNPETKSITPFHLDIFVQQSIDKVLEYIGFAQTTEGIVSLREYMQYEGRLRASKKKESD